MHKPLIGCALTLALASWAQAADVDWKVFSFVPDKGAYCFYDAKGVARTADIHIRVWTKCLSEKDLNSVDIKSELGKKIVENAGRKVADIYVPPYALIEDINRDQAIDVIRYEETANLSDIRPQARFFYEFNCSERMMRRLSTYVRINGKDAFDDKPSSWQHIPPEGGGTNLLKILCPQHALGLPYNIMH
jgi:hypothetical protein